jgi:O-methyltransferase
MSDSRRDRWLAALERRHLADLRFAEVTRAVRALSSIYVERRERLSGQTALDSAGKRAAYAMYYSPLHFLTVAAIVDALGATQPMGRLMDLGCGAGAAGGAWATALDARPSVLGVDTLPWALDEAAFTYRSLDLDSQTRRAHAARLIVPRNVDAVVAGWMVNELDEASRASLLTNLLQAVAAGTQVLVIEPIATRVSPWWPDWTRAFADAGGRHDEWRISTALPDLVKRLDVAAGLRHDVLTAKSLFFSPRASASGPSR